MPELPEVETIRKDLMRHVVGSRIQKVSVLDHRVIRNCSKSAFIKRCDGQVVKDICRRGKAIIIRFKEKDYLVIQPMMTGQLICVKDFKTTKVKKETKIIFELSNRASLIYNDQRLFGRVNYLKDLDEMEFLRTIGPEPLEREFNETWIADELKNRKGPIKSLLLNQHFVAGIGNIYACEILFNSRIHPRRGANTLEKNEIELLKKSTVKVLKEAISLRGTSMRNYLDGYGQKGKFNNRIKVYNRENAACVNCQKPIKRIVQAGRSTFYCDRCQK